MQLKSSGTELRCGWFKSKFQLSALNRSCQLFWHIKDRKVWTMQLGNNAVTVFFCASVGKAKFLLKIIKVYGGGGVVPQVKK